MASFKLFLIILIYICCIRVTHGNIESINDETVNMKNNSKEVAQIRSTVNNGSIPTSCKEIFRAGQKQSGIYVIQPKSMNETLKVFCDMETDGGGWIVIQNRFNGSQDFYLEWRNYKCGFGHLNGEFWLGLEYIYRITGYETNQLLVILKDKDNIELKAYYEEFSIGSEWEAYNLNKLKGYSGNAGDALKAHIYLPFTTKDFDRDLNPNANCAELSMGAWWYGGCFTSNLNGKYLNADLPEAYTHKGMHWQGLRPLEYSFSTSKMLVREIY